MFTVDMALQHTCASFRERAARGEITEAERDLLIDGAILLAMHIEMMSQDALAAEHQAGLAAGLYSQGRPAA